MDAEKKIKCYQCFSEKITAYIYFSIENKPLVSFDCAKCSKPIMGLEITTDSLKFVLGSEDASKKLT